MIARAQISRYIHPIGLQYRRYSSTVSGPLSRQHIDTFLDVGYVVVPGLIPPELVTRHREQVLQFAEKHGVRQDDPSTWKNFSNIGRGFGGMIEFMHGEAANHIRQLDSLHLAYAQLFEATYCEDDTQWPNRLGSFSPERMYCFLNRCCYRAPSKDNAPQRDTGVHLDLNPYDPFQLNEAGTSQLMFWQPIQGMLAVTDSLQRGSGGFTDHTDVKQEAPKDLSLKRGNATDLNDRFPPEKMEFVPLKEGDFLFWDWRLPHSSEAENREGFRQVLYVGHLPDVQLNRDFIERQKTILETGRHHNFMSKKFIDIEVDGYKPFEWSPLGKNLMGLQPW
ncbi:hypothetical protein PROFUN_05307 [Planoprotostelium fungivorum]|uniref:Phytanoyl-CoA dioxygenase n=1 Tax=Planoprotostelium fungivorum TaxID=1890364 RepID=A0A2P6NRD9_9EUKA|nr:hypothetical protein PROFUN_05307 [Planoprotostelium fungivorum]